MRNGFKLKLKRASIFSPIAGLPTAKQQYNSIVDRGGKGKNKKVTVISMRGAI